MRVAVISDIHGNARALEAVLAATEDAHVEAIWCLGDLVGYGPRPNDCVRLARERTAVCLAGNHDLGVLGRIDLDDFAAEAGVAARWSATVLEDEPRAFLEGLAPQAELPGAQLFHASARDPVWEYVLSEDAAVASLLATTAPLVLVGHSHVALALLLEDGRRAAGGLAPEGAEVDVRAGRWLLNPGSVGQPRDGDPRAAWLLLDTDAASVTFRRTVYDVAGTQAEIRVARLPEALALRLAAGA